MEQTLGELIVRQEGQFLDVVPVPEELHQVLRTEVHVLQMDVQRSLAVGRVPAPLYREMTDENGTVLDCHAGLLPVVFRFAERAGYPIRLQRQPPVRLPEPDFPSPEQLAPLDRGFLRCVQQHERAIVRYDSSTVDPARLVAQVATAWPQLTIAVAVTRIEEARQVRNHLLQYLPGVVAVTSRNRVPDSEVGRVVVATYNALGHTGIEIEKRDIVLALNAVEASSPHALSCLGHAKRARMYGLLAKASALAPYDQDVIPRLFGFQEVVVPGHGVEEVRVEVIWCRKVGCPVLPDTLDLVQVKGKGLWHNHARNRQVASLARRLQAGDWQANGTDLSSLAGTTRVAVAILVENVEHAEALASYLPDWLVKVSSALRADSGKQTSLLDSAETGIITTAMGAEEMDLGSIDVLIRADGGVGLPPVTGFPPGQIIYPKKNLPEKRLVLVDVFDRHHPLLRRWIRQRRAAYAERGWFAPGVDPVEERIQQFLLRRGQYAGQGKSQANPQ